HLVLGPERGGARGLRLEAAATAAPATAASAALLGLGQRALQGVLRPEGRGGGALRAASREVDRAARERTLHLGRAGEILLGLGKLLATRLGGIAPLTAALDRVGRPLLEVDALGLVGERDEGLPRLD